MKKDKIGYIDKEFVESYTGFILEESGFLK